MNDRFKFRVWDKELKRMYRVIYLQDLSGTLWITKAVDSLYTQERARSDVRFDDNVVLMQCTGLKDKNGKLIYEGDLLKSKILQNDYLIFCEKCRSIQPHNLDKGIGCYSCNNDLFFIDVLDDISDIEIIGNIYENPELLEAD